MWPSGHCSGFQHLSGTGLGHGAGGECFLWLTSPGLRFRLSGHTASGTSPALACSLCTPNPPDCFSTAQTSLHSTAPGNIVLTPTIDGGHLELHLNWGPQLFCRRIPTSAYFCLSLRGRRLILCFQVNLFSFFSFVICLLRCSLQSAISVGR